MATPFDDFLDVFPTNAVDLIHTRLTALYPTDVMLLKRLLKATDGPLAIGVAPDIWSPDESSNEIGALSPTVQRYIIKVQAFCKDMVEENGIRIHSAMSKAVRELLYNDAPLRIGLSALSVTVNGVTEKIQRRGIVRQKFISNEIDGAFLYLSTTDYYLETETK